MEKFNIHQAKTQFSRLVEKVAEGQEIIIAKSGKPIARLVPYVAKTGPRQLGQMRGKIKIKKQFDASLPEVLLRGFDAKS